MQDSEILTTDYSILLEEDDDDDLFTHSHNLFLTTKPPHRVF